ncbi:MAG: NfeD family protein, partial [Pseudomonadota bacterium]
DRALLQKMTARNQILYRVTHENEDVTFVIEDDWPQFLAANPGIDVDDKSQVVVYRGKDRLLTLTGREAHELKVATGIAPSLTALYQQLDVSADEVVDLSPSQAESLSWWLARFGPMLAALAFLFVIFELKTPGIGLWAALGAGFAALFLMAHYSLDLINNFEVLLLLIGVALVLLELFTGISGGVLAVIGAISAFSGLVLAFVPEEIPFDFSDERFLNVLADAGLSAAIAVAIMAGGFVLFASILPSRSVRERVAVQREIDGSSAGELEANRDRLVGLTAVAREALSPGGMIEIDGKTYTARSAHAAYIASGRPVEVVDVEFGELIVREIGEEESPEGARA